MITTDYEPFTLVNFFDQEISDTPQLRLRWTGLPIGQCRLKLGSIDMAEIIQQSIPVPDSKPHQLSKTYTSLCFVSEYETR